MYGPLWRNIIISLLLATNFARLPEFATKKPGMSAGVNRGSVLIVSGRRGMVIRCNKLQDQWFLASDCLIQVKSSA